MSTAQETGAVNATQETQEKRPELEPLYLDFSELGELLYLSSEDLIRCPCARGYHLLDSEFADKLLRVYDYAIINCPIQNRRYIVIAFFRKGEHHRAMMPYDRKIHLVLSSFNEKFRQRLAVLLRPCLHETPKGWRRLLLEPAA